MASISLVDIKIVSPNPEAWYATQRHLAEQSNPSTISVRVLHTHEFINRKYLIQPCRCYVDVGLESDKQHNSLISLVLETRSSTGYDKTPTSNLAPNTNNDSRCVTASPPMAWRGALVTLDQHSVDRLTQTPFLLHTQYIDS